MLLDDIYIHGRRYKPWDENYYVSAYGDVYSKRRELILRHHIKTFGYHNVCIYGRDRLVHRMVYEIWNGPIPEGLIVRHYDDNCDNNHYSNLILGTQKDNMADRLRNGHWRGGGPSNKIVLFDKRCDELIAYDSLGDFLYSHGISGHYSMPDLLARDWFNDRYQLLSYEMQRKPKKEPRDCRKPLDLLDKQSGNILHFDSIAEFKKFKNYNPNTSISVNSLLSKQWFNDQYIIINKESDS